MNNTEKKYIWNVFFSQFKIDQNIFGVPKNHIQQGKKTFFFLTNCCAWANGTPPLCNQPEDLKPEDLEKASTNLDLDVTHPFGNVCYCITLIDLSFGHFCSQYWTYSGAGVRAFVINPLVEAHWGRLEAPYLLSGDFCLLIFHLNASWGESD